MLVIAAAVYGGGRFLLSPRGRYVVVTSVLGGGAARVKPVLEGALGRAAQDLNLPPPHPQLICEPETDRTHLCSTMVVLTPGVSTLEANAGFTRQLLGMGVDLISGVEATNGTVNLLFQAGSKVRLALELVPAAGTGLDSVVAPSPGLPAVEVRGRLALIIDDYGERPDLSRRFAELPGTFTAAVRSNLENAQGWANEARQAGMDVILNLPMEPKNYPTRNPGQDAVLVDISGREIRKRVTRALDQVGPVQGVKTYMGSLAVEDRDVMRPVLEEMKERDLYFLDSARSEYSTVPDLARELEVLLYTVTSLSEVDAGRRGQSAIEIRFDDLMRRVRVKGYAIGIIHAKSNTLKVLEDRLPRLAREGIVVLGLTEVMKVHALE
jgi:polysaccharide deacetylase 2 family uncharacterized protein YibQ